MSDMEEDYDYSDMQYSDEYYSEGEDYGSEDWGSEQEDEGDWFMEEQEEPKEVEFVVLKAEELDQTQQNLMEDLGPLIDLTPADVGLLLKSKEFEWNAEKIRANFFNDPEKYLNQAGIRTGGKHKFVKKKFECMVCLETTSKGYHLSCGHKYCVDCWKDYLSVRVGDGPDMCTTRCMYPKCTVETNIDVWKQFANPTQYSRYMYFFRKHFVESNKKLSWCPNPSCGNAVRYEGIGRPSKVVTCTCGSSFCFACGYEKHNPVTCSQLDEWKLRNQDDQESLKLVKATSKPCFHCGMPVERTQGCNHMTCHKSQGGCGGEWCWMCRGDWKTHGEHTGGFFSCNKYDTSNAKDQDDEASKEKALAERFMHYYGRFFNHDMQEKDIVTLKEKNVEKMVQYRDQFNANPEFIMEATDLLEECRHTLKYTYVYGYFLEDNSEGKEFFEYLQANAEGITERLSDQLVKEIGDMDTDDLKNRIRVTKKYIENLSSSIEEGLGVENLGKKITKPHVEEIKKKK